MAWRRGLCDHRRSSRLLRNGGALANLFCVMPPMNPVKLAPLIGREGADERMIENFGAGAEAAFAIGESGFHPLNLRKYRNAHFGEGHALRESAFGCPAP